MEVKWSFRPLRIGETRIIVARDGKNIHGFLTKESIDLCCRTGSGLVPLQIKLAFCSPLASAVPTSYFMLAGMDARIRTDDRLAGMHLFPANLAMIREARVTATDNGLQGEEGTAAILFDSQQKYVSHDVFYALTKKQGEDCAFSLSQIAKRDPGQTILVVSHSFVIESAIMKLRGEEIHIPERLVKPCQIIEIIIGESTCPADVIWHDLAAG